MSGYTAGDTLILTIARGLSSFDATNTSSANWNVLRKGKSDHYVITKPLPPKREKHTMVTYMDYFVTSVEVWQRMKRGSSDAAIQALLNGHVKDVADRLETYNRLGDTGDTIVLARVTGFGDVQEMFNNKGALEWLMQEIFVEWWEERTPAYQDV